MQYMQQYISHRKFNGVDTFPQIAKELGVNRDTLYKLRSGKYELSRETAEKMATVTGLSPVYWLNLYNIEKYGDWVNGK